MNGAPSRSRPRHTLNWLARWLAGVGAIACVVLWVLNLWVWIAIYLTTTKDWGVGVLNGQVAVSVNYPPAFDTWIECTWLSDLPGYDMKYRFSHMRWIPRGGVIPQSGFPSWWDIQIPLWIPFVTFASLSAIAWKRERTRRRAGLCKRCGYDLAGLRAGAPCPECGHGSAR